MLKKLAFSQQVLRALSAEKQAGLALPIAAAGTGLALAAGAHVLRKGTAKEHEYRAGFAPGVAELEAYK